jgi:endonuclease YncB( thermonuclease family)
MTPWMPIRVLTLLAAAAVLLCAAAPAFAQDPPGVPGPCPQGDPRAQCFLWMGTVTFIGDGDTLSVDLDGDGTKKPVRVRMTGINAPEETVYTNRPEDRVGECHANEATARLEELVASAKGRVQLAAIDPESRSNSRLRRAVSIKVHAGWRDLGRSLINEGYVLWLPGRGEWAYNNSYGKLAQKARARYRGIWNSVACADGPEAHIRFWVSPDPEGNDDTRVNGEWFKLKNTDPVNAIDVSGWRVRDSDTRGYAIPPGTVIQPGATLTIYVGEGVNTPTDLFWGLRKPIFDNVRPDRLLGDGGYLFDLDGDLRGSVVYPCRWRCFDFAVGAITLRAAYKRSHEFVTVTNTGERTLDLEGYRLGTPPYAYVLGPDSALAPGEALTVNVKGDPALDSHLQRGWGKSKSILNNNGDSVRLRSPNWTEIACTAWGTQSC